MAEGANPERDVARLLTRLLSRGTGSGRSCLLYTKDKKRQPLFFQVFLSEFKTGRECPEGRGVVAGALVSPSRVLASACALG